MIHRFKTGDFSRLH